MTFLADVARASWSQSTSSDADESKLMVAILAQVTFDANRDRVILGPMALPPPVRRRPALRGALLSAALFGLTLLSTTLVGALRQLGPGDGWLAALRHLPLGLSYSLPLCAILACHELGHYLAALRHGAAVSLPLFIPFPLSEIGTLGAVIDLREEVRDRDALFDIAAAGPLLGLAAALPLLCVGIWLSPVLPVKPGDSIEGQSLLYLGVKYLLKGQWLPGFVAGRLTDVNLHPMALAGWVGLLLTMFNLLPIGQLDGGRVTAALLPGRSRAIGRAAHLGMVAMACVAALAFGVEAGLPWLVGAGLLLLLGRRLGPAWYPEVDAGPLSPGRRLVGGAMVALWALLLMPYFARRAA